MNSRSIPELSRTPAALLAGLVLVLACPARSFAGNSPGSKPSSPPRPTLLHSPLFSATPGRDLPIKAGATVRWRIKRSQVHYRTAGTARYRTVAFGTRAFGRGSRGRLVAIIPGRHVQPPGVEYYISSRSVTGRRILHLGSPSAPHRVRVRETRRTAYLRDKLARHQGHRSSLVATFRYLNLGHEPSDKPELRDDNHFWVEAEYRHRLLRLFYQISLAMGYMRGKTPLLKDSLDPNSPGQVAFASKNVGLVYGYSKVHLEFHRYISLAAKIIVGASADGFAIGGGGLLRIGETERTHFDAGAEIISGVGYVGWFEFAWDTVPGFMISLRAETSNQPAETETCSRAMLRVRWKLAPAWHLLLDGGYGRRHRSPNGGLLLGAGVAWNFR